MKWIRVDTGIPPISDTIIVYREDGSYDIGKKERAGFCYLDKNGNNIMTGSKPIHFLNFYGPELINSVQ